MQTEDMDDTEPVSGLEQGITMLVLLDVHVEVLQTSSMSKVENESACRNVGSCLSC